MTSTITLLVDGKTRYYGTETTADTAVWVLSRGRAQTFNQPDALAKLKHLQTTYRLPGNPQLRALD